MLPRAWLGLHESLQGQQLESSRVGAGEEAEGLLPSPLQRSGPTQPPALFFQHFAQIRGGRSPRALKGRARLREEPRTACSGALPGARTEADALRWEGSGVSPPLGPGTARVAGSAGSSYSFLAFFIKVFIVFCNKNICWGWVLPQMNSPCSWGRLVPPQLGAGARGRG